ncbi:hypothetical protein [Ornithinimicrobium kibberense]
MHLRRHQLPALPPRRRRHLAGRRGLPAHGLSPLDGQAAACAASDTTRP